MSYSILKYPKKNPLVKIRGQKNNGSDSFTDEMIGFKPLSSILHLERY